MRAFCWYSRRRYEPTHGFFFFPRDKPCHTTQHTTNATHNQTLTTQHNAPHCTPAPAPTPHITTPQHTQGTSHSHSQHIHHTHSQHTQNHFNTHTTHERHTHTRTHPHTTHVNATLTQSTSDRDLETQEGNAWICAPTHHGQCSCIRKIRNNCNVCNFMRTL